MSQKVDVTIVGGGPAGLAVAIHSAVRGLSTVVLERSVAEPDKACGEGLMPAGVRALDDLGALSLIEPSECAPFIGIRYLQEDGTAVEARFRNGGGLGIRRVALSRALAKRAREVGVELRQGCRMLGYRLDGTGVFINTSNGDLEAGIIIAADGLNSSLRRTAGLDLPVPGSRRFGMRRHFHIPAWSQFVEVYWSDGVEAYVTPSGTTRVGVAFLWEDSRIERASFDAFLGRFPMLAARVADAAPDSEICGAGPLARAASARILDRFVLVGDAAGYVDAITGEGLSVAFACAAALGEILPAAIKAGATQASLASYERAFAREFRHYAFAARALLTISRRPHLRRRLLHFLAAHPSLFESMLNWVIN
jgi:menaquinone-9 beta-reductase